MTMWIRGSTLFACVLCAGASWAQEEESGTSEADTPWFVSTALGAQFLPDYAEGKNNGFDEQRFFGSIVADAIWNIGGSRPRPVHWGVGLELFGDPVRREEAGGELPTDFNDIADTVRFSTYAYWQPWCWDKSTSEKGKDVCRSYFGPVARVGLDSRENLTESGDSVNGFFSFGARYVFEQYRDEGKRNGLVRGFAELAYGHFEEYAGVDDDERLLLTAAYQIFAERPVYIGFQGNVGTGPDELAVFLAFVFDAEKLLELFGTE